MSSNRSYELIYVLKPDAAESEVADMHKQVAEIAERMGGTIDKTENALPWGRRKLAYEIGHHKEGFYVLEVITGSGELMKEIDRRFRVTDTIIRHLTVRVDDDIKVAERLRAERKATQARRRTARGLPPEPQASERRGDRDNDDQDDGVMGLEAEGQR